MCFEVLYLLSLLTGRLSYFGDTDKIRSKFNIILISPERDNSK